MADFFSDPWDGYPITVRHHTAEDITRLRSNTVRTVAYPPWGGVWVGTNLGISRWDLGIERFVDVDLPAGVSTDISAIAFDGRANAWVGTRSGLVRIDGTSGDANIYTTENSGLVSNTIRDVFVDRPRGNVFVATDGGISILDTQIDTFTVVAESILPVPNPFVINSGSERLAFNYDGPAWVTLYTIAGETVAAFSVNETWDGRNQRGTAVASGAYLYVVTNGGDVLARGKVLVIRK
jgi:ligand-binding sensor domain-containing protein